MSFINYLVECLGEPKWNTSETEASWCCPFCTERGETEDTRFRFAFNVHKMVMHCFNCDYRASVVKFVKDYHKVTYAEALDIVNEFNEYRPLPTNIFDEVFDTLMLSDVDILENKKYIPLPNDFKLLCDCSKHNLMSKPFYNYAKSRLFTEEQLFTHKVGFCPQGDISFGGDKHITLKNRLIMQVFNDNNEPIYWNARDITGRLKPKSINPPKALNTINKSDVVFNLNNAKKEGMIIISEGIFDAITFGKYGVALFGKVMSTKQLIQIIKSGVDTVYIALDPDAFEDELKIARTLSRHIKDVYICHFKGDDPNSLGRKKSLEFIANAEKYDQYSDLKYKLGW